MTDLYNYECSDNGLILPIINEYLWHKGVRITLYFLGMVWCFLGLAIVADVFMVGIEKITSKTRNIKVSNPKSKDGYEEIEVKVWNDTVANLSLMAFGTSAPEILLNVIEVVGDNFKAGELGPATIVGSAAFNLLVISAVCVSSIPKGEGRKIENVRVYVATTCFSLFAYIWMLLVLKYITPDYVDLWEAIITFLMFPILIVASYLVDKLFCCPRRNKTSSSDIEIGIDNNDDGQNDENVNIIHMAKELGKHNIPEEEAAKIVAAKLSETRSHNKGWYRIQATRNLTGGHRLVPQVKDTFKNLYNQIHYKNILNSPEKEANGLNLDLTDNGAKAVVEFMTASCAIMENGGKVRLEVKRYGKLNLPISVRVETIDGTAEANSDYIPVKTKLVFAPQQTICKIDISIIDDDVWEPDEFFFAKLFIDHDDDNSQHVILGQTCINQITIINDDEPGVLEFTKPSYVVREGTGKAQLYVKRSNGADGIIHVNYATKDMSAESGKDYVSEEGTLEFKHGETQKTIDISLIDTDGDKPREDGKDCSFIAELSNATAGSKLGKIKRSIVTLVNDEEFKGMVSRIAAQTKQNLDSLKLESSSWKDQLHSAMNVNGGDIDNATNMDYVLHFLSFFWKVLFSFIPPPHIGGGWPTFILSLMMIGLLTALVGDLASIFGCLIGLNELITAITFVALGTSMPDTFASRTAATMERNADASIGNINGSNAVNVFLGLGLPWLLASIYWTSKGGRFYAPAGTLTFSVVLYMSTAVCTVVLFFLRRKLTNIFGGSELGGLVPGKIFTSIVLVCLWVFYIVLSSLQSEDIIPGI